jgi:hypothetical protein
VALAAAASMNVRRPRTRLKPSVNGAREIAARFVTIERSELTLWLRVVAWWKLSWRGNKKTVKREEKKLFCGRIRGKWVHWWRDAVGVKWFVIPWQKPMLKFARAGELHPS